MEDVNLRRGAPFSRDAQRSVRSSRAFRALCCALRLNGDCQLMVDQYQFTLRERAAKVQVAMLACA